MAGIAHVVQQHRMNGKKRTHLILLPKERNIENMKDLLHLQQKLNFAKDE